MKWVVGVVLVLAAAVALYAVSVNRSYTGGQTATSASEVLSSFSSPHVGLSFGYPNIYQATTTHLSNANEEWHVVTLLPKGYVPPQDGDGPAAISVQAIPNPKNLSIEKWIKTDSRSNWQLMQDSGGLGSRVVGGEAAMAYKYSGLYNSSAVVVAHKGMIYFFVGEWNSPEDSLYTDFQKMLDSVTFI